MDIFCTTGGIPLSMLSVKELETRITSGQFRVMLPLASKAQLAAVLNAVDKPNRALMVNLSMLGMETTFHSTCGRSSPLEHATDELYVTKLLVAITEDVPLATIGPLPSYTRDQTAFIAKLKVALRLLRTSIKETHSDLAIQQCTSPIAAVDAALADIEISLSDDERDKAPQQLANKRTRA